MSELYKLKSTGRGDCNKVITKDGHTMFLQDAVKDLNKLESQLQAAKAKIKELERTCLNKDVVEFVRCGIGSNYGGKFYLEKIEEVYEPIKRLYESLPPQPKGE